MFRISIASFNGNEVIYVCFSNNFLEQGAYLFCNKIIKETTYEIVCLEVGGKRLQYQGFLSSENDHSLQHDALISKIHLKDKTGNVYFVEPNLNGLKFAKGEISFDEYIRQQKKGERLAFFIYGVIVSALLTVGLLIKLSIG